MSRYKDVGNGQLKKLSYWRVAITVLILIAICLGFGYSIYSKRVVLTANSNKPWFASYVDATATPAYAFEQIGTTKNRDAILSFIVSSSTDGCTPTWGNAYTLDQASTSIDLDRRIDTLQQQGGSVAVSFGGRNNQELANACTNPDLLFNAYQSVVDRYHINTIDLDIESTSLKDPAANARRADAIAKLQSTRRSKGKNLAVWVTLPATPQGLTVDGKNMIFDLISKGVDISGVNVLAMDYGESLSSGQSMLSGAESALNQTQRQLGIIYELNNTHLSSATLWSKIGVTPMIGQNDTYDEVFTLSDASGLNKFSRSRGVGRISMWSANRDKSCGINYINLKIVSDACSGVAQSNNEFSKLLSEGFIGDVSLNSSLVTKSTKTSSTAQTPDDPATSPYQIWAINNTYAAQTKVVWHHTVYRAKWYTQGDIPDNPVLESWQTPWEVIGPVLPGEKPAVKQTLPAGTYPSWSGSKIYTAGDIILLDGVPYQAKWWTQGDSPAAAEYNANNSPWVPLSDSQIKFIKSTL